MSHWMRSSPASMANARPHNTERNGPGQHRARMVLRYRDDYGLKYVEINEYTSEKRE